jgi:hypothetical protein
MATHEGPKMRITLIRHPHLYFKPRTGTAMPGNRTSIHDWHVWLLRPKQLSPNYSYKIVVFDSVYLNLTIFTT